MSPTVKETPLQSPEVTTRAAAPTSPEPVHPAGVLWRPQMSHLDERPLNAWLEMTGTCGQAHKETHPVRQAPLPKLLFFLPTHGRGPSSPHGRGHH